MARLLILLGLAAVVASVVTIFRQGRGRWVGCCVLTVAVAVGVLAYAFVPTRDGLTFAKAVGFLGGQIAAAAVSLIPSMAWLLVSRVHPQNTLGGRIYAVVYSVLIGLCFIPGGLLAAACYFPARAREVLGRLADALPGKSNRNTTASDN